MRIDHVIYAVHDLDAAADRIDREFGLGSVPGGRHPGWGTANRIVPLGDDYLELMTIADPSAARDTEVGEPMLQALARGGGLLGWAVATDDIDGVAESLGLEVTGGSRTRPDGVVLRWRLAGVESALADGAFPLLIQWDVPPDLHPGRAHADHRIAPTGISWSRSGRRMASSAPGWRISTFRSASSMVPPGSGRRRSPPPPPRWCCPSPVYPFLIRSC
jgi:hypothetical protein